jgi:hypothetical protein
MNRLIYVLLLAVVGIVPVAYTQTSSSLNVERAKQVLTTARRDIFEATMDLTAEQKDGFWTLYNEFEKERTPVTERTLEIVKEYVNNFSTLTDDQLMKIMKDATQNNKKQIDLRYKYAEKMAKNKSLGPKVGLRFYEIDDYITTAARLDVLDSIPFVSQSD